MSETRPSNDPTAYVSLDKRQCEYCGKEKDRRGFAKHFKACREDAEMKTRYAAAAAAAEAISSRKRRVSAEVQRTPKRGEYLDILAIML